MAKTIEAGLLEASEFRAGYYIVLYWFPEICEVGAVAGYSYHQVSVFFGVFLGVSQGLAVHYV